MTMEEIRGPLAGFLAAAMIFATAGTSAAAERTDTADYGGAEPAENTTGTEYGISGDTEVAAARQI